MPMIRVCMGAGSWRHGSARWWHRYPAFEGLWDNDTIVNRMIVYGSLTGILGALGEQWSLEADKNQLRGREGILQ
jgi:NADH:ubiquinone oxidoreductase subunit F (NADH-binding)